MVDAAARMPTPTTAEIDETLVIGGEEIDARKLRSRMTVDVMVNDTGPYRFVVDSGADTSVVGLRLAEKLGLPAAPRVMLNAMTESAIVDQVKVEELRLGPTSILDLEVPVLREVDIGGDGMVGLDALVEQRLMMDFDRRVITVDDASSPEPWVDGVIVVKGRLRRGQLILTQVSAEGVHVDAVVDTGSEISIGNRALRDKLFRRNSDKFEKVKILGVTGVPAEIEIATVSSLKLGPVTLRNVPIAFADVPPFEVFGLHEEASLLLGTDVMETFRRVSLDFRERKVRFQLRECDRSVVRLRTSTMASLISADQESACER